MRTLPGQLPSDQIAGLLAPYEEFEAFVADLTTIRVVTDLVELSQEGHAVCAFNYINTMGSGGGLLHGESGQRVLTAELRGGPRPPLFVRRRRPSATLRHMFGRKVRVEGSAEFTKAFFVASADAEGARVALPPDLMVHLGRTRPEVDIEVRGNRLVAWRRGTVAGDEQLRFIEETAPIVPLFTRSDYRS